MKNAPCPYRLVFRRIVEILKKDPVVGSKVRTWFVFDGTTDKLDDPTPGECPAIELLPTIGASQGYGAGCQQAVLMVRIGITVAGFDLDPLFDLRHDVELALWPRDSTRMQLVRSILTAPLSGVNSGITDEAVTFNAPFSVKVGEGPTLSGESMLMVRVKGEG